MSPVLGYGKQRRMVISQREAMKLPQYMEGHVPSGYRRVLERRAGAASSVERPNCLNGHLDALAWCDLDQKIEGPENND